MYLPAAWPYLAVIALLVALFVLDARGQRRATLALVERVLITATEREARSAHAHARLLDRADEAHDRLVAAWKEGYSVPPPAAEAPAPPPALDPMVDEWIDQYDEAEARDRWRRIAREYHALGRSPSAIVMALEARRDGAGPDGADA
jgi:hypothetical protein